MAVSHRSGQRERTHAVVDALGLVLLACVHAADVHDRDGARLLVGATPPGELQRLQLGVGRQG
jgi:hypothetical protein